MRLCSPSCLETVLWCASSTRPSKRHQRWTARKPHLDLQMPWSWHRGPGHLQKTGRETESELGEISFQYPQGLFWFTRSLPCRLGDLVEITDSNKFKPEIEKHSVGLYCGRAKGCHWKNADSAISAQVGTDQLKCPKIQLLYSTLLCRWCSKDTVLPKWECS